MGGRAGAEFSRDAARGVQDGGEGGLVSIGGRVVFEHVRAGNMIEQYVRINIAQLSLTTHVSPATSRESTNKGHIDSYVAFVCEV